MPFHPKPGRSRLLATLVVAVLASTVVQARELAGVSIPDTAAVASSDLVLNGAGIRSRFFVKVYVGALYLGQKSSDAAAIIDGARPARIGMRMLREVDDTTLHGALDDGLRANNTPQTLAEIAPQLSELEATMKRIGKTRVGDTINLDFTSDGVTISLNGAQRGKLAGAGFARAMLRIWLGDHPADESLKKGMLGN